MRKMIEKLIYGAILGAFLLGVTITGLELLGASAAAITAATPVLISIFIILGILKVADVMDGDLP